MGCVAMEEDRFWFTQIHVMSTHVQQEPDREASPNMGEKNQAPHVTVVLSFGSPSEKCQALCDNCPQGPRAPSSSKSLSASR